MNTTFRTASIAITSVLLASMSIMVHSAELTSDVKNRVISKTAELLEQKYIAPDMGAAMANDLRDRLIAGEYDGIDDTEEFGALLTRQLRQTSNDEHLWIMYTDPPMRTASELDDNSPETQRANQAMHEHFGFGVRSVANLSGNVGYLDFRGFMDVEPSRPMLGTVMNFLQYTGGLIIDLRNNGGGQPETVALLASYFLGPEPQHVNSIYWRDTDKTDEFWTTNILDGKWYGTSRPVYILTSKSTFSAAESFSSLMQASGRAKIVGEVTRGGANPGSIVAVDNNFRMFVSTGRASTPIDNSTWEGTGVIPDIAMDAEQARAEVEKMLLRDVISMTADPLAKANREEALQALENAK